MLMRGGTSKGAYFLASDLPTNAEERDELLLRIMGSPDARQIDGVGGGHPLSSKVAVVSRSAAAEADVDYLFLQVVVDQAVVSDAQTCGNLLAGVGPFALERGLVQIYEDRSRVRVRMMNPTKFVAVQTVSTPGGRVNYAGVLRISGVPFPAAPVEIELATPEAPLFPTGTTTSQYEGLAVTCIDAGMPVVLIQANDLGLIGAEPPAVLEGDARLKERLEAVRLLAGVDMGLGDVRQATVPKMCIISPPRDGGLVSTRTFIPHRVHTSIGVLGAVSVAAGCLTPGTVAREYGHVGARPDGACRIEHPTGYFDVVAELDQDGGTTSVRRAAVVRTARKLFDGRVWPRQKVAQ